MNLRSQSPAPDRTSAVEHGLVFFLCLVACLPHPARAQSTNRPPPAATLGELRQQLTEHISQTRFAAATWGIKIVSLDAEKTLFELNAGKLLKPASNAKLFTSALAMDRLGPDFRIRTSLLSITRPDRRGVLRGDLIVFGRGDPSFAARFNEGVHTRSLRPLVEAIVAVGIKQIKGDLVGDESFFRGPPFGSGWTWDDLAYDYGAEVSALTQEDNVADIEIKPADKHLQPCRIVAKPDTSVLTFINRTVTLGADRERMIAIHKLPAQNLVYVSGHLPLRGTNHIDAVTVHDPALWFVTRLKKELTERGVNVAGKVRTVNWLNETYPPGAAPHPVEIAFVESRPLAEIVARMMKPSQNLYAQLLLLQVGARAGAGESKPRDGQSPGAFDQTTEQRGIGELRRFCGEIGIPKGEVLLDEGSGLSRRALVTPNAIVELLVFMNHHPHADVFRQTLPVAGVDGSLRHRMKGTAAERNVAAKTGTIGYVHTLSGYVTTAAKERLAFSTMLNAYDADAKPAHEDLDAIAVRLAEFNGHSTETNVTH